MEIIPINDLFRADTLQRLKAGLERDAVLIYPTDTLYGLGGNFLSAGLSAKIDSLKQRSAAPYSAAVSDSEMITYLVADIPEMFRFLIEELLPGPYTFISYAAENVGADILKNSKKIAVRMPDHPPILKMIKYLGFPLVSTSVNKSDFKPMREPAQMIRQFPSVDFFIDAGSAPESAGSTVIDLTCDPVTVRRIGDGLEKFKKLALPFTVSL